MGEAETQAAGLEGDLPLGEYTVVQPIVDILDRPDTEPSRVPAEDWEK